MATDSEDRKLKERLCAEFGQGKVVFAKHKATGLMAFRLPTEEEYLDFVGSIGAPHESTGIAREQFCVDMLVYPTEPESRAKVRRALRALPNMATTIAAEIEAKSCGDYEPYNPSAKDDAKLILELSSKWEFGWGGITPKDRDPVILAADETSGILVRVANDARQNGDADNGRKIRTAVIEMVRSYNKDSFEALLAERPALIMPLWYRAQEQAGAGAVELGND